MFGYRSILTEPARPAVIRESPKAPWLAVGVVCFGAFMGQLDASIVTIAFPAMERAFHTSVAAVQWVSLTYLLGLVAMLVPAGLLGDAIGRKLVYGYGFAVFTVASLVAGVAPSLGVLVIIRVVQAAGAAMLQANSVALVTTTAPKGRLRFALGVQAGAQAIGLALGPVVGGLLTATVGWRAVFLVNVPVGVVALVAGRYLLPRTREFSTQRRFDAPGAVLLTACTTALLLALSAASGLAMPAWLIALLGIGTVTTGAAFARRQQETKHPLIPLGLLRAGPVRRGLAGAACGYLVLFGPLVLVPQLLRDQDAARTGLLLAALPLGFGVAALAGDAVLPKAGRSSSHRAIAGAAVAVAALAAAALLPDTPTAIVPLLALAGLGLGIFIPANNALIMRAGPHSSASLLGGMVSMARGLGTSFGISAVALTLHLGGGRLAFALFAVVAALAAALARTSEPASQVKAGEGR